MFYLPDMQFLDRAAALARLRVNDYIEIGILVFMLYYIVSKVRKTRIWILTKGCIIVLLLYQAAYALSFGVITYIAQGLFTFAAIALVIMFQPELRKVLESLGKKDFTARRMLDAVRRKSEKETNYSKESINELVKAVNVMSKAKTGALILIERNSDLGSYEESGIPLHADITSQLLINAFEKNTPLHDGAMIIRDNEITAATCYLPLSDNRSIDKDLGTRHRAAIGASEETDALILVVSEETGAISVAEHGKIQHGISLEKLREILVDSQEKGNLFQETHEPQFWSNMKNFVLSAVLGAAGWVFITGIVDPTVTYSFNSIPVEIVNDANIADAGYIYEITKGGTVNIDVTGKKSIISRMTASDFNAYADADEISISNSMNIEVEAKKHNTEIRIDSHNAMLTVSVEEAVSIDCPVVAESTGDAMKGYYVAKLTPETGTVTVTGAKSKLKTIDKAAAVTDISQVTSDFEIKAPIRIYDKNGNLFDMSACTVSVSEVKVMGTVYETKSVPVKITAYDSSYEGCKVSIGKIDAGRREILVAGNRQNLKKIKEAELSIDVAGAGNKVSITINPANYLPKGIFYAENKEMEVTMEVSRTIKKSFAVTAKDIRQENGKAAILDEYCSIKVECDADAQYDDILENLDPYIELDGVPAGKSEVPLRFSRNGFKVIGNPKVSIKVRNREA